MLGVKSDRARRSVTEGKRRIEGGRTASSVGAVDLSILIVNYNTAALLRQCLRSIYKAGISFPFEVIVVDNASTDGSPQTVRDEFPQVRLIENEENVGFSVANNAAMDCAYGRYVLLLNSDTIVVPGTLATMVEYLETNRDVGIAGCRLMRPGGEMDLACRRSFPTPIVSLCRFLRLNRLFPKHKLFGRYNLTYLDEEGTYDVDSIVGAFMLVRRSVIEEVGGLDEDYFMYGEDIDWCYRIQKAGHRVAYVGSCVTYHYKGASSRKESFRMNYHFHRAMILFHRKHLHRAYSLPLDIAIYVGIASRFLLLAVNHYLVRVLHALRWPFTALIGRRATKRRIARQRAATKLLTLPEGSLERSA